MGYTYNEAAEYMKKRTFEFVTWLMDNCELIQDRDGKNVLWRYNGEDYTFEKLYTIYKVL